jgi:threonine/homoserine/homoserine lactone efflux protein
MLTSLVSFAAFAALLTITPGLDTMFVVRTAAVSGRRAGFAAAVGIGSGCLCWAVASGLGITALLTASQLGYDLMRWLGAAYLCAFGARQLWRSRPGRPPATVAPAAFGPATAVAPAAFGPTAAVQHADPVSPDARLTDRAGARLAGDLPPVGDFRPSADLPAGFDVPRRSAAASFRVGLLTNLLNPKVGVFYLAALPQFLPHGAAPLPWSLLLGVVHDIEGIIWFTALIFAVNRAAGWFARADVRRWLDRLTGLVFVGFGVRLALESRS